MSSDAAPLRPSAPRLVRGGLGIGAATTVASGANYLSNVVLGRWLAPADFADAALVVSGLLLMSAIALGFQLHAARAVAAGDRDHIAEVKRVAVVVGLLAGAAIAVTAPIVAALVNMAGPIPLVVLGFGLPLYLPMAVRRGVAQANHEFGRLGASLAIEAFARLAVTVGAVAAGLGATGAAVALVASFAAARLPCRGSSPAEASRAAHRRSASTVAATVLLLAGQVVISNGDLWVVSATLRDDAGVYAAVALIGRLVFITAWSVVTVVFPSLVADGGHGGEGATGPRRLLGRALAATAAFGLALTGGAAAFGDRLIVSMVGDEYADGAALLWPYALATTLFVLANLCAVADMAAGRLAAPVVVAAGAVAQTVTLAFGAGAGIAWVVWAQVVTMGALLVASAGVVYGRRIRLGPTAHRASVGVVPRLHGA